MKLAYWKYRDKDSYKLVYKFTTVFRYKTCLCSNWFAQEHLCQENTIRETNKEEKKEKNEEGRGWGEGGGRGGKTRIK